MHPEIAIRMMNSFCFLVIIQVDIFCCRSEAAAVPTEEEESDDDVSYLFSDNLFLRGMLA
jgi:hypothetical protein